MIVLDTSAIVAAANHDDPSYERLVSTLDQEPGPLVLPVPILSEIAYMMESGLGVPVVAAFLDAINAGHFSMDCCHNDAAVVRRLVERYQDMPLGTSDAYVAACARRSGGRILTLDRRHFSVLSREFGFTLLP